jgi:UDP-N-acetylmuramoylalanine--D-glutamate ligase
MNTPSLYPRAWFFDKTVTVFGIGVNGGGIGTLQFLLAAGVKRVLASDLKTREDLAPALGALEGDPRITYTFGSHPESDFTATDLVIKTPGVRWDHPLLVLASSHGIPVTMDAAILVSSLERQQTIGITGTRGKTTTASLIAHILESAGRHVVRVGISQYGVLSELPKVTPQSVVVLELSSWRLSALDRSAWSPATAVVTNVYPDHLNYYGSMGAYIHDKQVIVRYQELSDHAVLNGDNAVVRQSFGTEGLGTRVWVEKRSVHGYSFDEVNFTYHNTVLFPRSIAPLLGEHNAYNICLALSAVHSYSLTPEQLAVALQTFPQLDHRLELVAEVAGVRYINDSAATSPDGAVAALSSIPGSITLITGGVDKDFDDASYMRLAAAIGRFAQYTVFLPGTGTDRLIPYLPADYSDQYQVATSLQQALDLARAHADESSAVLLSPGFASFNLFKNEFDRGEQFRKLITSLQK